LSVKAARAADRGPVYFLSDYGRADEFVGVVHAVIDRGAPGTLVIDLTHDIAPFDVRAGAAALGRALPHLGPGIVLAVVDPGVGGQRRGLVLASSGPGPRFFVGPDNGLLLGALHASGGPSEAVALAPQADVAGAATFDGRDVFAPAVAALAGGAQPGDLGEPVGSETLVSLRPPLLSSRILSPGHRLLRAEVTWVDRFGNLQLAAPGGELPATLERLSARVVSGSPAGPTEVGQLRRVRTFDELSPGELGILVDANDQVAVVGGQTSAAARLGVTAGGVVELGW